MKKEIKPILERIKSYLKEKYGDGVKQVILYGSYARGEEREDSDVDILIVIDDSLNPGEVEESISDLLFEILLDKRELISVMAIPLKKFKNYNSPFILNVKEEGITI